MAVFDNMPHVLWARYFLEAQGIPVKPAKIYQDNLSAILLEKNGKRSSGRKTRHIDIRYFFVTDRSDSNEVTIEHCPAKYMAGDFFTKPTQGGAFYDFRAFILNLEHGGRPGMIPDSDNRDHGSVLGEL